MMKKVFDDLIVAVFTYKQQDYIEQSIVSIYEQSIWPRKLYIFDDCSPDKTLEIIHDVVKNKPDGLDVEVIENTVNIGLVSQLNKLRNQFSDTLIVVQAGDDLSKPDRLEKQYQVWKGNKNAKLVLSQFDKIDHKGDFVSGVDENEIFECNANNIIERDVIPAGCTAAIDCSLLNDFPELDKNIINEDRVFIFRAHLKGKAIKIMQPLISYRYDVGISAIKSNSKEDFINKWLMMYHREKIDLQTNIHDAEHVGAVSELKLLKERMKFILFLDELFNGVYPSRLSAWKSVILQGISIKRMPKIKRRIAKYFAYIR
ncbi:glycosyltransferase [Vibrio navarrensis]|uniref:glycosyltransferase n=1 Tax=Vibrio navarrensis TaxID=29495 RepID=UPI001D0477EF|nr:glycosyltransferase [Vibrio navarrensis]